MGELLLREAACFAQEPDVGPEGGEVLVRARSLLLGHGRSTLGSLDPQIDYESVACSVSTTLEA